MKYQISSKHLFKIGSNQFKISRTDHFNTTCKIFFKWFTTDAQVIVLAEKIALTLIDRPEIFNQEIRIDFDIKEEGAYALYLMFSQKDNTFFEIKLTSFIKASKIKENDATQSIPFESYKYAYKLIPRDSDHFHAVANLEELRYKIYYSNHLIYKKEHFFKKYNFQRLASDVLKYLIINDLSESLSDGTPLRIKVKPTIDNEAVNHTLYVTCSFWFDAKSQEPIPYYFIIDSVRYLSAASKVIIADNFFVDKVFDLNKVKLLETKDKPKGLKIIKKKALG